MPLASANPRVVRLYDPAAASAAEMRLAALVASASLASAAKEAERSARRSPTLCQTSRSRSVGGHATAALAGDGAPAWAGGSHRCRGKSAVLARSPVVISAAATRVSGPACILWESKTISRVP